MVVTALFSLQKVSKESNSYRSSPFPERLETIPQTLETHSSLIKAGLTLETDF